MNAPCQLGTAQSRGFRRLATLNIVGVVATLAALLQLSGCSRRQTPETVVPSHSVLWAWSGGTSSSSATVSAKLAAISTSVQLVLSAAPDLSSPAAISEAGQTDASGRIKLSVSGLAPATRYWYGFRIGATDHLAGRLTTLPSAGTPASFRFGVASCALLPDAPVFEAIHAQDPAFFLFTGDFFYANIANNNPDTYRTSYDQALGAQQGGRLTRYTPTAYVWDDHDYGPDNCDARNPSKIAAHSVYRQLVPHWPLALSGAAASNSTTAIAQTFTAGRVRFLLSDLRTDNRAAMDGSQLMSPEQLEWLTKEAKAAAEAGQLVVWVSSVPWNGVAAKGTNDAWASAPAQRTAVADAIKDTGATVVVLAGDAHMCALDDGANTDFATDGGMPMPLMQAAPLYQETSFKGGPYNQGVCRREMDGDAVYGGVGSLFGLVDVTDDGQSLALDLSARWGNDGQGNTVVTATHDAAGQTLASAGTPLSWGVSYPTVTVTADHPRLARGASTAVTVTRGGPTTEALAVLLAASGTAPDTSANLDATTVTIPAGSSSATTILRAVSQPASAKEASVTVKVKPRRGYLVGGSATVTLSAGAASLAASQSPVTTPMPTMSAPTRAHLVKPSATLPEQTDLPDLWIGPEGTRITPGQWPGQRAHLKDMLQHFLYGQLPPPPRQITCTLVPGSSRAYVTAAGTAAAEHAVTISFDGFSFNSHLYKPDAGRAAFPVVVILSWDFNPSAEDQFTSANLNHLLDRGYAVANLVCTDIALDEGPGAGDRSRGLFAAYPALDFGAVGAWATGISRVVDYLHTLPWVDTAKIAVTGHSRLGKAALCAAIYDERIALVNPSASGLGGAGSFRIRGDKTGRDSGISAGPNAIERIGALAKNYPHWFTTNFAAFADAETRLPFDLHTAKALIAPRALISTDALDDTWANPYGTHMTSLAAGEIFAALGVPQNIAAHFRDGGHKPQLEDMQAMTDFADYVFYKITPARPSDNWQETHPPAVAEISQPPTADLAVAAFRLVVPPDITPRAILVLVPGSNSDGRPLADDPVWREWAAARQLALLGCHLQDQPGPDPWMERYADAGKGSGQALLDALKKLAATVKQPALAKLPLILVGTSAGGQFAYEFTCWKPGRVLAFVAHKGGVYYTHLAPPEARRVPGLFLIGGADLVHRRLSLTGIWSMGRRSGAHWALVDEPGVGHNEVAFASLSRTFLDDGLALRLPGKEMLPAPTEAGWVIGCELKTPCPEPQDPHGPATTGWLPGRASAEATQPFAPHF